MSIRVGIVGISGFGGGEALRLVAGHPSFDLVYAAGEGSAGSRLADRFPGVPARLADRVIEKWDPATLPALDVLFASLPTGASAEAPVGSDANSTSSAGRVAGSHFSITLSASRAGTPGKRSARRLPALPSPAA